MSQIEAKEPPKVVVIGAGLAGLTTTYRLREAGFDVELFEARSRPGGRVFTAHFGDSYEELGGKNLMDGGEPKNILPLIEEMGLKVISQERVLDYVFFSDDNLFSFDALFKEGPIPSEAALQDLEQRSQSAQNLSEVLDYFLKEHTELRQIAEVMVKSWEGSDSSLLSPKHGTKSFWMLYSYFYSMHNSGDFDFSPSSMQYVEGGNSRLIHALAGKVEGHIHYNSVLMSIQKGPEEQLELHFQDGKTVFADHLVLAVPCSVLSDITIEEGVIPKTQFYNIKSLQYGTNAKILLPVHHTHADTLPRLVTPNRVLFFNKDNTILTFYFGGASGAFSLAEAQEVLEKEIATLQKIYPDIQFPAGIDLKEEGCPMALSWLHEPFSKGSYCNYSPFQYEAFNSWIRDQGEWVRRPFRSIGKKIFFAGEHTALEGIGSMEGAVESAERTARMIKKIQT